MCKTKRSSPCITLIFTVLQKHAKLCCAALLSQSNHKSKLLVNTMGDANVHQFTILSFRLIVHFFPSVKGEQRARCTCLCLGHATFQFSVLWETSDAEVEDGPLS